MSILDIFRKKKPQKKTESNPFGLIAAKLGEQTREFQKLQVSTGYARRRLRAKGTGFGRAKLRAFVRMSNLESLARNRVRRLQAIERRYAQSSPAELIATEATS